MADLSAYISFLVKFDVTNINTPVLVLTDNAVYPGGVAPTLTGVFTITQPDGMTRTGSFTTPDIAWNGTILPPASIALRLATGNLIQQGAYTIKYEISATGYVPTTLVRTFIISYTRPALILGQYFDVFTPSLSYQDATVYTAGQFAQSITRSWSATIGTVGSITGTNSASFDLKYGIYYYDAAYVINFSASVVYQSNIYNYVSIADLFTKTVNTDAYTPPTTSVLLSYMTTLKAKIDALHCQNQDKAREDYEYAFILYEHALKRICASDTVGVDAYIQEIINIVNNNVALSRTHTNAIILPYSYDCSGSSSTTTPFIVEVVAGTSQAIAAGVIVGATTFTNTQIANRYIEIIRGHILVPGIDPLNGGEYYTKTYSSSTATFSMAIQAGEYVKISTESIASNLPFVVEVVMGTSTAISAGLIVGATTYINSLMIGKFIEVVRGNIPLAGINPMDGSEFMTKILSSNTITFSAPLQDTEYIKISTL